MLDARRLVRAAAVIAAPFVVSCHAARPPEPDPASLFDRPRMLAAAMVPAGPVALTATDGTGLRLQTLHGHVVLQGPLAFTELQVAFENPEDRVLEGTFRVALPQQASLARFAMRIGADWQEGEVVVRSRAREAYEDALHHKQDPALLEQSSGNEFSARVFPIPARGVKDITIAWVQELPGDAPYVLPLRGLPRLDALELDASVPGQRSPIASLVRRESAPTEDFVAARPASAEEGLRSGDLAVVRVRPEVSAEADTLRGAVVLFDTSASRALGFAAQLDRLSDLLRRLTPDARVTVACFDQAVEEVYDGSAAEFGDKARVRIRARGAMGASNIGWALGWARERAAATGAKRVVLLTDGVATAGPSDAGSLAAAARALRTAGVERVDVVAEGGIRDEAVLRALVKAGLARDGVVADEAEGGAGLAKRLDAATRSHVKVDVEGARWWWPRTIDGAQPGDATLVYAEVDAQRPVVVSLGGAEAHTANLSEVDRPLLERAWAQAKVAALAEEQARPGSSPDLERTIEDFSVAQRVVGPATAMVVLETDFDYQRFAIDRKAAANVLVADGGRVVRSARPRMPVDAPSKAAATEYSYSFQDDPLAAGGFGPSDATIRVAPSPGRAMQVPRPESDSFHFLLPPASAQPPPSAGGEMPHAPPPLDPGGPRDSSFRDGPARFADDPLGAGGAAGAGDGWDGERQSLAPPYEGVFADVMSSLTRRDVREALRIAAGWHAEEPGDVMALVAIGEALEAAGAKRAAARAYGSLVDLFPSRADLRRFAGERLERLGDDASLDLAIDAYARAVEERPDHPSGHRLLAFALLRRGRYAQAFEAVLAGLAYPYPPGRFNGVQQVLRDDLGLIAAAWTKAEPARAAEIRGKLVAADGTIEDAPSLRFILNWETDANDVDLHVVDVRGHHAYFRQPSLPSGGTLYADVTTGYGPECFTIRAAGDRRAGPYSLFVHYYARGPMGYGMGKVEIIEHDGAGGLTFGERPFVVMNDRAAVELGSTP